MRLATRAETGDPPMPRSLPVKPVSDCEIAELHAQLIDQLDRGPGLDPALE